MYTELANENFVGAWWVAPVAGLIASIVSLSICACCKKSTGFEHKASIIRNSTRRTDDQTREVPEKEAAVVGRWDCLIDIDELEIKPPEKFIPPEKLKRLSMAPKAPPPDLLPSSHLATMRYHDRSGKSSNESARQARSLYLTDQPTTTEPISPTFNLPKRHSSFFEYKKFNSPSKPTSKTSSPPPLFDHYDVRVSSPSQLQQQQRQRSDSGATENTNISAFSTNNQTTKKENHMRFSPPPIFEGRREETALDIEVYTPPPIPPRNYLFLENEGPEDEPVILQNSPSSIKERYRNYRRSYNADISPNNTLRYPNELPGFQLYRADDKTRSSNYSQNFPSNGIAVQYQKRDNHVIRRPPAIRVDAEYHHQHQRMCGIDNRGYVRYNEEERVQSHELGEDGFVRLRPHPDVVYRNNYDNIRRRMNEHRYSMDFDGYRVPLRRSPYDRERLVDRPQRFSSFISEDYDDLWRFGESPRREAPVFREPKSKTSSIPNEKSQETLEAPIPKPRMLRRSTVGDITMQEEERKHAPDGNEKVSSETQKSKNENTKKSLRIKIYEQLKDEPVKKLENLEIIIDKILDVINEPDVGARELKKEANEVETETQLRTSNDQFLRERSSSLPDAPALANHLPLENQLQTQARNKNEENEDKMLKRFKGNFEDKNDQKRRKRAGSGRRSLKKSSKPSEKAPPPEVVKVTVLPVANNSRDLLNKLEEQTNNEIKSLERLQIKNDQHKISKSHDDIFRDVEMQSSESSRLKTNSSLELPVINPRSSSPSFKTKAQVPPIPQRSNLPFVNRQHKNKQTVNSGTSMRFRSATPPVAMDISPKRQERNAKRFSVHGTVFSSQGSPNLSVNNKPKLKESKSSEGKLSSGSMRRVSRTGEIVRIPAEDEYSIPYDCVVSQSGSGLVSPTYSIPLSDMDRPPRSPSSNHSSGMSNLGSNWSVNGKITPRTPDSGRFNFGSRDLGGIVESGYINSDNDDYDYADPIN